MTARLAWLLLALLACTARADAAVIEGRISHPTRPEAAARLELEAIGLDPEEKAIVRRTKSDAEGRYRFADLPAPAAYLVRARYQGMTFPGGSAAFPPAEKDKRQTLDFSIYDKSEARSAGVWRVQESATIANPDSVVVLVPPAQPAPVSIGLAAGHGPLETFFGRLPDGVEIREAAAEIRGPVFPGDQGFTLQVEYDLAPKGDLASVIEVPSGVDNLAVYVQDFGVEVEAGDLHPARPARQEDQTYQAFLGFDVPAGTRLPLHVRVLPPVSRAPLALVALLAALAAGALLFFVAAPVVREALARDTLPQESLEPESPAKAALAAALHDLEHDFETGKLSAEDRVRLREDLRHEALTALARERYGSSEPPPEAIQFGCSCGRLASPGDRFCAACGKAL